MDIEVCIEKDRIRPKVVVHTNEMTQEIADLIKRLTDYSDQMVVGYQNEKVYLLRLEEIYQIYAQNQKVFARTQKDTFQLKFRMYELEDRLSGTQLIRISKLYHYHSYRTV